MSRRPTSGLLGLPRELLAIIIEDESLERKDLKNLRRAHSGFNRVVSTNLFRRVGFSFLWRRLLVDVTLLENVEELKGSEMADAVRTFYVNISSRTPDVEAFIAALPAARAKLDGIFPNVKEVELDLKLPRLNVERGTTLLTEMGRYATGKVFSISLRGLTQHRLETIRAVPQDVQRLTLECSASGSEMLAVAKSVNECLRRSTNLRRLEICNFGTSSRILFDGVGDGALCRLEYIKARNNASQSVLTSPGLLGPQSLQNLRSLRGLEVDRAESDRILNNKTLWDELRAYPGIQLETLLPSTTTDSLIEYISLKENTSRLENLQILSIWPGSWASDPNSDLKWGGNVWLPEDVAQRWGDRIFNHILPNIAATIKNFEMRLCGDNGREDDEYYRKDLKRYADLTRYFSFIDRGRDYHFPRLEKLSVILLWEPGALASCMKALQRSPRLKLAQLGVEYTGPAKDARSRDEAEASVYSEIVDAIIPDRATSASWTPRGFILQVRVNVVDAVVKFWLPDKRYRLIGQRFIEFPIH